jgi:hypothetical protein
MSKEQLLALASDVDRLLVAGGSVAAGDEGLKRREKVLRQLGEKVPVLAQVADAVKRVVTSEPSQATLALLDLLQRVQQVRYSLADANVSGTLTPLDRSGPWRSAAVARDLYPVHEALTATGSGRMEVLRDAVARGVVRDLRLVDHLLAGLDDTFDAVANQVADEALPAVGSAIVPELRRGLDLTRGKSQDARRLRALCKIDTRAGGESCQKALAEGNASLRAQALKCLHEFAPAEAERAALEQLDQKPAMEVRCAALGVLGTSRRDAALNALVSAAADAEEVWVAAVAPLQSLPHPQTDARMIQELQAALAEQDAPVKKPASAKPAKGKTATTTRARKGESAKDKALLRFRRLAHVLGKRGNPQSVPALLPLLQHAQADVREAAVNTLTELGEPEGLEAAVDLLEDSKVWQAAVRAVWKLPPGPCYERLAPLCASLSQAKKGAARERGEFVLKLFQQTAEAEALAANTPSGGPPAPRPRTWDSRWVKLLHEHLDGPNRTGVAVALALVQGQKAVPELLRVLPASIKKGECEVAEALGRLRVREAIAPMIELLPGQAPHHHCIHDALRLIGDPAAIPLLERILEKTKDYRRWAIERLIQDLKPAAPGNDS